VEKIKTDIRIRKLKIHRGEVLKIKHLLLAYYKERNMKLYKGPTKLYKVEL